MARDGTWGDHLILKAAARHFNCVIHIISSHPEFDVEIEPDSNSTTCDVAELLLGHIYEYHYVSLEAGTASLTFIELFWKKYLICQWFERMYLCGFVALYVRMSVVGANKVESTLSWCVGINEILVSNMTFTRLQVKQGHFETAKCFDSSQFFHLLLWLKVFRSITLNYLYNLNAEYSDGAV